MTKPIQKLKGKRVLLVGNYSPDRQESMQRFAHLMEAELACNGLIPELIKPEAAFGKLAVNSPGFKKLLGYLDKFVTFPIGLKRRLRRDPRVDMVHICDHSNAVYVKHLGGLPHLVTCHDMLAVRSAQGEFPLHHTRWSGQRYQRMILNGINRAGRVACVSFKTREDVLRIAKLKPGQVSVVRNGLNYNYQPIPPQETAAIISSLDARLAAAVLGSGFILHVGGNTWYKNRTGVVSIYNALIQRDPDPPLLVLAGQQPNDELKALIETLGIASKIVVISGLSNELIRVLYSQARVFLFPSLEEVFGWPIVEAQACGCPVLTTDKSPMTEVGGPSAMYCDPVHWEESASALEALLREPPAQRAARISQGLQNAAMFSTENMVQGYLNLYSELLCAA